MMSIMEDDDEHEFLRYLVESLQKCYLTARKVPKNLDTYSKETTPFNQIFGGYMRQDVHCLKCKYVSTTFQHFMDLLLDIRQANNIDEALNGYFKKEMLGQGENMYKCEKCKQKVPAWKQYKIERPPLVLCVQLKRFNLMGGKNGRPVTMTRKLDVSQHVRSANVRGMNVSYKLVSMITHVGPSPNCGHYTAIGEASNGTFYRFDDSSVHPTSVQNVLNTSAYVIFYEMLPNSRNSILAPQESKSSKPSTAVSSSSSMSSSSSKLSPPSPRPTNQTKPTVIGPQLPPTPDIKPPKPPVLVKNLPKVISEPNKLGVIAKKPSSPAPRLTNGDEKSSVAKTVAPIPKMTPLVSKTTPIPKATPSVLKKGLVPYDGNDTSSDDDNNDVPFRSIPPSSKPSPFVPRVVATALRKSNPEEKPTVAAPSSPVVAKTTPIPDDNIVRASPLPGERGPLFLVTDKEAHNPSVHSDNSTGSTASNFTVTELRLTPRPSSACEARDVSCTSQQRWNVTPVHKRERHGSCDGTPVHKRERSVPPPERHSREEETCASDTELVASPKKRKKTITAFDDKTKKTATIFDDVKQRTTETLKEFGKDVLSAGTKFKLSLGFKSNKVTDKVKTFKQMAEDIVEKVEAEAEASTSCVATTSTVNENSSSTISLKTDSSTKKDDTDCGEDESDEEKEAKKKKKKKHKHKKKKDKTESDSDQEEWQEKTKDNLQNFEQVKKSKVKSLSDDEKKRSRSSSKSPERTKSSCNPDAPVKRWDSKPELGAIGRSVTWDGSKGADIVAELNKGSGIRSWSGDRSHLEKKRDERKRGADTDNDEMDRGRVKKVKKRKEEASAYHKSSNPFQTAQNVQNRHENKDRSNDRDGSTDRRSSGSNFQRSDFRNNSGYKGHDNRANQHNNRIYAGDNRFNNGGDNRFNNGDSNRFNNGGDNRFNNGGDSRFNNGDNNRFNNRNSHGSGNNWGNQR